MANAVFAGRRKTHGAVSLGRLGCWVEARNQQNGGALVGPRHFPYSLGRSNRPKKNRVFLPPLELFGLRGIEVEASTDSNLSTIGSGHCPWRTPLQGGRFGPFPGFTADGLRARKNNRTADAHRCPQMMNELQQFVRPQKRGVRRVSQLFTTIQLPSRHFKLSGWFTYRENLRDWQDSCRDTRRPD